MSIESSPSPPRQAIEDQIARILASPAFSKSDRMSRFLKFIAAKSLDGRGEDLKEYSIALEVFDKDETFDPRIDPTVRSEARRLRSKLSEYYSGTQAGDRVLIELPKGAYTLAFHEIPATEEAAPMEKPAYRFSGMATVGVLLAIAAAVLWWYRRPHPAHAEPRSIAVLPFENLSADASNEYFSDGLTEEILNALANAPGFKVVARTSSFAFKGKHEDIRSIGKKLNVGLVLEGTVRKDGDHMRITPQLINAKDGYHLWSAEYERESKDLFTVQREIATAIAGVLGGKLGPGAPQPVDPETYRLYLEALFHFNKWNATDMAKASHLFEGAIARDPRYAPAYAGASSAYGLLAAFGGDAEPGSELRAKARRAALRAIELDPVLCDAWLSLAPQLAEDFDWPAAEGAFRKALELGPNSSNAHAWYSELYLSPHGRLKEALQESQAAAELDPLSPYAISGVGIRYYLLKQYDFAIAWARKALDIAPAFGIARSLALNAYICKGDIAGARQFLTGLQPAQHGAMEAQLLAAEGNRAEALKTLAGVATRPEMTCLAAGAHLLLGDRQEAIAWLDRAIDARSSCFEVVPVDPRFDRLHGSPEFTGLLRKMKLAAGQ